MRALAWLGLVLVVSFVALTLWERGFKQFKATVRLVLGSDRMPDNPVVRTSDVPIIVSLTASPLRLASSIPRVLHSIRHVTNDVRLVLPRAFRNKDPYDESVVSSLPATLVRIQDDLGPLSKALPVLETIASQSRDCVLITIDDDALYDAQDLVSLAERAHREGRIVTGFARWDEALGIRIPFGNNAIAYPKSIVTPAFVRHIWKVAKEGGESCKMHDDMVLAVAASRDGQPQPLTQTVNRNLLVDSFGEDALMYAFPDKDRQCAAMFSVLQSVST